MINQRFDDSNKRMNRHARPEGEDAYNEEPDETKDDSTTADGESRVTPSENNQSLSQV